MIKVNVTCLVSSNFSDSKFSTEADNGCTIKELIFKIAINEKETFTVIVNGEKKDLNYVLQDNDNLSIIPQILGG